MSPDIQKKLLELAEVKSKRDALPALMVQAKTQIEKFGDEAIRALEKINISQIVRNAGIRFELSAEFDCGHNNAFGGYAVRLIRGLNFKPSDFAAFVSPLVLADDKLKLNVRFFKFYPCKGQGGMETYYSTAHLCHLLINRGKEENWAQISRGTLEDELLTTISYSDVVPRWQNVKDPKSVPLLFDEVISFIVSFLINKLSNY